MARFCVHARYTEIWGHVDGSARKSNTLELHSESNSLSEDTYEEELADWQMNEDRAKYVLALKIPESIHMNCPQKSTAAEILRRCLAWILPSVLRRVNERAQGPHVVTNGPAETEEAEGTGGPYARVQGQMIRSVSPRRRKVGVTYLDP